MFILGGITGLITGVVVALFIIGATNKEKERDAYIQGFKDGEVSVYMSGSCD
jgi:hypothetical protein